ncbi:hypothetical protein E2C01_000338 [Portunus trituberculatus]|uniref:Uncharacterized protein n=1 Tax=Portunus trituberculatus TaxID=210409 RepID=A0A5B7CEY9_PORTR|nr:hypothetical protein [Portunus trituberculatus]
MFTESWWREAVTKETLDLPTLHSTPTLTLYNDCDASEELECSLDVFFSEAPNPSSSEDTTVSFFKGLRQLSSDSVSCVDDSLDSALRTRPLAPEEAAAFRV